MYFLLGDGFKIETSSTNNIQTDILPSLAQAERNFLHNNIQTDILSSLAQAECNFPRT